MYTMKTLKLPSVKTLGFLTKILDFPTKSCYLLNFFIRSWKVLLLPKSLQFLHKNLALPRKSLSYQEIREVKISIISKFSAISQIVELDLFTVILGHVMEKSIKFTLFQQIYGQFQRPIVCNYQFCKFSILYDQFCVWNM